VAALSAEFDVKLKRVYKLKSPSDGTRILVDRLWPRGVTKRAAAIDCWCRDLAPSTELRQWFGHDLGRWNEFRRRYAAELRAHHEQLDELRRLARKGPITLIFGARDEKLNDAVVLKSVLLRDSRR